MLFELLSIALYVLSSQQYHPIGNLCEYCQYYGTVLWCLRACQSSTRLPSNTTEYFGIFRIQKSIWQSVPTIIELKCCIGIVLWCFAFFAHKISIASFTSSNYSSIFPLYCSKFSHAQVTRLITSTVPLTMWPICYRRATYQLAVSSAHSYHSQIEWQPSSALHFLCFDLWM